MCRSHLNNEQYYQYLFENNRSLIANEKIISFANKYCSILTDNEYEYLINRNYKISTFYMNPKLHKSMITSILLKIYKLKVYQLLLGQFITQVEFLKCYI